MGTLLVATTLLLAVMLSDFAHRSVLSTSVLFLAAGFLFGDGALGWIHLDASSPVFERLLELALFTVLFTDGMKVSLKALRAGWQLPGRAILVGMPITFLAIAGLGAWLLKMHWTEACLVAAVLTPTDPVFAEAIVGREGVPARLRHLLNVESGLNDGLALPAVLLFLGLCGGVKSFNLLLLGEGALGVLIGAVASWGVLRARRLKPFGAAPQLEPLEGFAIGLFVYALAQTLHANPFLAAFAAGVTVATTAPAVEKAFASFGKLLSELLKLAALFMFGALLSPRFLAEISWPGYLFALLVLLLVRPLGLLPALAGTPMPSKERWAAAWFGPKGFAAVLYGLWVMRSGVPVANLTAHLVGLVVAGSILAHSSTDVLIGRTLKDSET